MAHGRVDQTAKSFTLDSLPTELLLKICGRLIPEDILLIFALVNKQFAEITDSDDLWHSKVNLHFPHVAQKLEARVNNTIDKDRYDFDSDSDSDCRAVEAIDLNHDNKWLHLYKQQWLKRIECLDPASDPYESDDDIDPIPHVGRLFSIMTEGDYDLFLQLPRYEHTVFFVKDRKDRSCSDLVIQSGSQQLLNHLYANYKEVAKYQKDYDSHRFYVPYTQATFSRRNLRYDDGKTLLYFAIAYGQSLEEIRCLMQDGSKFDEKWTSYKKLQPIHLAAKFGRIDVIDYLITNYPVTLEDEDKSQQTPLHYAVKHNQIKTVEFLIAKKVNLEHKDNEERNALMYALERENFPLMLTLLKAGANFSVDIRIAGLGMGDEELSGDLLILYMLASLDAQEYIDKILELKPELLKLKVDGLTVLDYAIQLRNLRAMKYFISRKVAFDGKSLLQAVAKREGEDIDEANNVIAHLNEYYPQLLDQFDIEGNTCLHIAAVNYNWKTAKIIMQLKPDLITRGNKAGKTPLLMTAEKGNLINLLKNCPRFSDHLEQVTVENDTVLHIAMRKGSIKTIKKVLKLKPQLINSKNKSGQTPLQLLQPQLFVDAFKLLRDKNKLNDLSEEDKFFIFKSILTTPPYDFLVEMAQELFMAQPVFLIKALEENNQNVQQACSWLFTTAKTNEQLFSLLLAGDHIITDEEVLKKAFWTARDKWRMERNKESASILIALLKKYRQLPQFSYMDPYCVVQEALNCNDYDMLKNMIEEDIITIEETNGYNSTLLLRAIQKWDSLHHPEGKVVQEKAMEFIQWLIKKGANLHAANYYGNTPYAYCIGAPLSQAKMFGAKFSLIDENDLQIVSAEGMRSPLMMAIRRNQDLSALIDATQLDDPKKQMVKSLANYLQDRYDDSRDYRTKIFCIFDVGCNRLQKIHASLAAINAILKDEDLHELINDRQYHRALTNSRLGKIVASYLENNKPALQPASQALMV